MKKLLLTTLISTFPLYQAIADHAIIHSVIVPNSFDGTIVLEPDSGATVDWFSRRNDNPFGHAVNVHVGVGPEGSTFTPKSIYKPFACQGHPVHLGPNLSYDITLTTNEKDACEITVTPH